MSQDFEGFIVKNARNSSKPGAGKTWFKCSFRLGLPNGEEIDKWFQLPFNTENPYAEGDYIKVRGAEDQYGFQVDKHKKIEAPARTAPPKSSGGGGRGPTESELFGLIGGYYTEDDIKRITFSTALGAAVDVAKELRELDGLPEVNKGKTAAHKVQRYDEYLAVIQKLATRFFYDIATLRVIDNVQDEGTVDVKADAPLPDPVDPQNVVAEPQDTGQAPPEDDSDW